MAVEMLGLIVLPLCMLLLPMVQSDECVDVNCTNRTGITGLQLNITCTLNFKIPDNCSVTRAFWRRNYDNRTEDICEMEPSETDPNKTEWKCNDDPEFSGSNIKNTIYLQIRNLTKASSGSYTLGQVFTDCCGATSSEGNFSVEVDRQNVEPRNKETSLSNTSKIVGILLCMLLLMAGRAATL